MKKTDFVNPFFKISHIPARFLSAWKLTNINDHLKKRIKLFPVGPDFFLFSNPILTGLFVPASYAKIIRHILLITNKVVKLQWEVLTQQHATFAFINKVSSFSSYNREQYYWLVMNTFFGLEINHNNKLPASYVLREFLQNYFCQKYALYNNPKCSCENCNLETLDKWSLERLCILRMIFWKIIPINECIRRGKNINWLFYMIS